MTSDEQERQAYFSQAAHRWGDYIAKIAVVPVSPRQEALDDAKVDDKDPDGLRKATVGYLRGNDAEFEFRVQLCTDLDKMPIENANKEWSENDSPYLPVGRLRLPRQDAYSPACAAYVNDALSFCVSHSLKAHRPLGSIQRARLPAYLHMSRARRQTNGQPLAEPRSIEETPA